MAATLTWVVCAGSAWAVTGLHVSGNRLLTGSDRPITLQGVDRSGTEYACIQGWGIFDGPSGAASVKAIASWHVDLVRVPINEDCWLGINGVKPSYGGRAYRRAPGIEELEAAYAETGTIAGVAEHFDVPVHTAQGWISRLRRKTAAQANS